MEDRVRILVGGISLLYFGTLLSAGQDIVLNFKERVVTDLKLFKLGAPIDFSYNETSVFPGEIVSSPGCPKSHEGRPWVYYGSPLKCYLVGFHGPCPFGKRMFSVTNSKYGVCNCDCFSREIKASSRLAHPNLEASIGIVNYNTNDINPNSLRRRVRSHEPYISRGDSPPARMINSSLFPFFEKTEEKRRCNRTKSSTTTPKTPVDAETQAEISNYFLPPRPSKISVDSKDRYSFCYSDWHQRQVVYDSLRQECTPFLDQGPCQNGEWLVRDLDKENGVTCEKRKCPEIESVNLKPEYGGSYSYFDYRRQACFTEVFGNLQEQFFANSGSIIPGSNFWFCRDAGLKYSQRLKTCVRDLAHLFQYKVIG